jgi:fermentation-respiration switch protein FrsA (DUF1100 family)
VFIAAAVACSAVGGALLVDAAPTGARAQPSDSDARRVHPVGVRVLALEDPTRATPADPEGRFAASPTRRLTTSVFYPAALGIPGTTSTTALAFGDDGPAAIADARAAEGRYPVILFSGGAPGTPTDYEPLLATWAKLGYVVIAPEFPVSSLTGPTPVAWADQPDQVRDARFVLRRMLALDRAPVRDGGFAGLLDRRHIAAAGHSMGGLTTLALISRCCREPRIAAAVVLAGVSDPLAGPALHDITGPVLFAHDRWDIAVPYGQGKRAFAAASPPKYLLEVDYPLAGVASHLLPYFPGTPFAAGVAAVFADFLAGYLRGDGPALSRLGADARSEDGLHWHAVP